MQWSAPPRPEQLPQPPPPPPWPAAAQVRPPAFVLSALLLQPKWAMNLSGVTGLGAALAGGAALALHRWRSPPPLLPPLAAALAEAAATGVAVALASNSRYQAVGIGLPGKDLKTGRIGWLRWLLLVGGPGGGGSRWGREGRGARARGAPALHFLCSLAPPLPLPTFRTRTDERMDRRRRTTWACRRPTGCTAGPLARSSSPAWPTVSSAHTGSLTLRVSALPQPAPPLSPCGCAWFCVCGQGQTAVLLRLRMALVTWLHQHRPHAHASAAARPPAPAGLYLGGWPATAADLPPGEVALLDVTNELPIPVRNGMAPVDASHRASSCHVEEACCGVHASTGGSAGHVPGCPLPPALPHALLLPLPAARLQRPLPASRQAALCAIPLHRRFRRQPTAASPAGKRMGCALSRCRCELPIAQSVPWPP